MCQATIYRIQNGREKEIMCDEVPMEPVEKGVQLQAFFEQPVTVPVWAGRIDFSRHTVTPVPVEEG